MIEHVPAWMPLAGYAIGFVMGATSGIRFHFFRKLLSRRGSTRRGGNPPPTGQRPAPPPDPPRPEQPLSADLMRYFNWRNEQIERALRNQPPTENPSQHP